MSILRKLLKKNKNKCKNGKIKSKKLIKFENN